MIIFLRWTKRTNVGLEGWRSQSLVEQRADCGIQWWKEMFRVSNRQGSESQDEQPSEMRSHKKRNRGVQENRGDRRHTDGGFGQQTGTLKLISFFCRQRLEKIETWGESSRAWHILFLIVEWAEGECESISACEREIFRTGRKDDFVLVTAVTSNKERLSPYYPSIPIRAMLWGSGEKWEKRVAYIFSPRSDPFRDSLSSRLFLSRPWRVFLNEKTLWMTFRSEPWIESRKERLLFHGLNHHIYSSSFVFSKEVLVGWRCCS